MIKACFGVLADTIAVVLFSLTGPFLAVLANCVRRRSRKRDDFRVVFGSAPIKNNKYWSDAVNNIGRHSETFVTNVYSINERDDWDRVLTDEFSFVPLRLRPFLAFLDGLFRYDMFVIPFSGFFVGHIPFARRMQSVLFRMAGAKVVVIPYGADAFVYRNVRSVALMHGLLTSYPKGGRRQGEVAEQVEYWCRSADCVIAANMGPDGIGRWDTLIYSPLAIDMDEWRPRHVTRSVDGSNGVVRIAHAPNHRGFKGTEFIIRAVDELKQEGLNVELLLLEGIKNSVVRDVLSTSADILVEQLVYTGYTLNGIEGLASAIPVVANLEDETYLLPFRRWSYFSECPVVSATPENIKEVLRSLVQDPALRDTLGKLGREYAGRYHSIEAAQFLFSRVIDYVRGHRPSIMNIYHPVFGEGKDRPELGRPPLFKNRLSQ